MHMAKSSKKRHQPTLHFCSIAEVAFPDHEYIPTRGLKLRNALTIAFDISGELWTPVGLIGARQPSFAAFGMLVPEAAMHEDGLTAADEGHIRFTGQVTAMKPIAIAEGMGETPYLQFGFHSLAADGAHVGASPLRTDLVHPANLCGRRFSASPFRPDFSVCKT
jgi:hypothetical protein